MRNNTLAAILVVTLAGAAHAGECASEYQLDGAVCYPNCKAGFSGGGPICYKNCAAGFVDGGAICTKPEVTIPKTSRGRDAGSPLICDGEEDQNGLFCYPKCHAGYRGVGPVCWPDCPSGYHDDGATCRRDADIFGKASYWVGAGHCRSGFRNVVGVCWQDCPADHHDDGATCRRDAHIFAKASYTRATRPLHACPSGKRIEGALCFTPCADGYRGVGPLCWPDCAAGFHDDGTVCHKEAIILGKESYGRGVGMLKRSDYEGIFTRYIQSTYNTLKPSSVPLTTAEKSFLKKWFPDRLVDHIVVTEQTWPGPTPFFPADVGAVTLGHDFIAIQAGARTLQLLKHELVHICQYDKLGTQQFGHDYGSQFVDAAYEYYSIAFESDAFTFAASSSSTPIDQYKGFDGTRGDLYAGCK